jgi:hypothetical protein
MQKEELEARLAILSKRLEPLERFLEIFAKNLQPPFFYDSGLQHFGFRYGKPDMRHFCLLKSIRALSSLNASIELVRNGYTQELYVLLRTAALTAPGESHSAALGRRIISGELPPTATRMVRQWALARNAELQDNWRRARAHLPLEKIAGPDADE